MKLIKMCVLAVLVCWLIGGAASADIVEFHLTGNGGDGLLNTNVTPPTGSVGEGGMGISGITLDTDINILHIDIQWGTGNGYSGDLTGPVTKLHLHGPTPGGAPDSFSQTGPLMVTLSNSLSFNGSAINGGVNDDFFINTSDIAAVLDGRTYINVHTDAFEFGEIRGYLVRTVPEPGSVATISALLMLTGLRRRRRR